MTLEARIEALLARAADLTDDEVRELEGLVNLQDSGVSTDDGWSVDEEFDYRKQMSGPEINDLPDSAFAYVEPGGSKDESGKTVPRSLRHYPVHDESHARNAWSRANAQIKGSGAGKAIAQKALPKIKLALKKFGVETHDDDKATSTRTVCPGCGSDADAKQVDDEMRCPGCGTYRGDASTVKGANLDDGTYAGGGVNAAGVPDGTGSVSSKHAAEARYADLSSAYDELARAFSTFVLEQKNAQGEDGTKPADEDFGDGSDLPHDETDDEQVRETEHDDPEVDEGDEVKEGDALPNEQESEPERKSEKRSRYKPRRSSTPAPKAEHRSRVTPLEIRSSKDGGPLLEGKAIVYNTPYTVYDAFGAFTERMSPSVCDYVLSSSDLDCRFLINHEGLPLARSLSGTLELNNSADALAIAAHLSPNSTLASDLADAIARKDVTQMSVGFRVADDEWDDDYMNRTVHRFSDLLDASAVTYPASPTTSIDVAKRMIFSLPIEARSSVTGAYDIVCDISEGSKLERACSGEVLRVLEMLYNVDDPQAPLVRVREAWKIARDIRAGKALSANNAGFIAAALESLHRVDDVDIEQIQESLENVDEAVDEAMDALAKVSGLPNPDDDEGDEEETERAAEPIDEDEARRKSELALEEAAERRRRAAQAARERRARRSKARASAAE